MLSSSLIYQFMMFTFLKLEFSNASSLLRKLYHSSKSNLGFLIKGGYSNATLLNFESENYENDDIELLGCTNEAVNGVYIKIDGFYNGYPHYKKLDGGDQSNFKGLDLCWSGNQWIIRYNTDSLSQENNEDVIIGYSKSKAKNPTSTSRNWHIKSGNIFELSLNTLLISSGDAEEIIDFNHVKGKLITEDILGIPKKLFPLYMSFLLDSISVGLIMPLLPFYIMELGANAMQLSLVVSSNYMVQMIGCLIMGHVSDRFGRKVVLLLCLLASSISYFCVSYANTLTDVALARIIVGSFGGLVPVMQSCVADVTDERERPQYLGRVTATFGLGFVIGPAISTLLPHLSVRHKIRLAAILPMSGFLLSFFFFKETKSTLNTTSKHPGTSTATQNIHI